MCESLEPTEYDVRIDGKGKPISIRMQLNPDGDYELCTPEDTTEVPKAREKKGIPQIKGQISIDEIFSIKDAELQEKRRRQQQLREEFGDDILAGPEEDMYKPPIDDVKTAALRASGNRKPKRGQNYPKHQWEKYYHN